MAAALPGLTSAFQEKESRMSEAQIPLILYGFTIMFLNGHPSQSVLGTSVPSSSIRTVPCDHPNLPGRGSHVCLIGTWLP